ncbi:MAG TPA: DUF433 domain-containing protein [Bryobacteraceae bacterium]|nr:DUF433 domain-containing protein [Bryobacteraceae bacterium]
MEHLQRGGLCPCGQYSLAYAERIEHRCDATDAETLAERHLGPVIERSLILSLLDGGWTMEDILQTHPGLKLADIYAAIKYRKS